MTDPMFIAALREIVHEELRSGVPQETVARILQNAAADLMPETDGLRIGSLVDKRAGYRFPGTVVSVYANLAGQTRVVVELDELGLQHIFSPWQMMQGR